MKFIASKIHWIGIILLVGFTAAAAGLYFDTPSVPKKKSAAPISEVKAAATDGASHAGCNHGVAAAQKSEHGCGMAAGASEESHGCCGGKTETSNSILPAGHPPVDGYTVASDPHAGCAHGAEKAVEKTAVQP